MIPLPDALSSGYNAQFRLPDLPEPHPQYPPRYGPPHHPPPKIVSSIVRHSVASDAGEWIPVQHIPPPPVPFTRAQIPSPDLYWSPPIPQQDSEVLPSPLARENPKVPSREEGLRSPPFSDTLPFIPGQSEHGHTSLPSKSTDVAPISTREQNAQLATPSKRSGQRKYMARSYSGTFESDPHNASQTRNSKKKEPLFTESSTELPHLEHQRRQETEKRSDGLSEKSSQLHTNGQHHASTLNLTERNPTRGRKSHSQDQTDSRQKQRSPWPESSRSYERPFHGFSYSPEEKGNSARNSQQELSIDSRLRGKWRHIHIPRGVESPPPSTKSGASDELPRPRESHYNLMKSTKPVHGRRFFTSPNDFITGHTRGRKISPHQRSTKQVMPNTFYASSDFHPCRGRAPTPPSDPATLSPDNSIAIATKSSADASRVPAFYPPQDPVELLVRTPSDIYSAVATAGSRSSRGHCEEERSPIEFDESSKLSPANNVEVIADLTGSTEDFSKTSTRFREARQSSRILPHLELFRGEQGALFNDEDSNLSVKLNRADKRYRSTRGSNSSLKGSNQNARSPRIPGRGRSSKQAEKRFDSVINYTSERGKLNRNGENARVQASSGSQTRGSTQHRHSEPHIGPEGGDHDQRAPWKAYKHTVRFASPSANPCASCKSAAHNRDMASPRDLLREEKEQRLARGNKPVFGTDGKVLPCDKCSRESETAWYDRVRGRRLYCWECFESKVEWHHDYWGARIKMDKDKDDKAKTRA